MKIQKEQDEKKLSRGERKQRVVAYAAKKLYSANEWNNEAEYKKMKPSHQKELREAVKYVVNIQKTKGVDDEVVKRAGGYNSHAYQVVKDWKPSRKLGFKV